MDSLHTGYSDDLGKLMLRIAVGGMMLFHGVAKLLHGIGWMPPMLQMHGIPGSLAYCIFIAEVIAPLFILAGWGTRLFTLTITVDMIMAIWLEFRDRIFTIKPGGGGWTIELEVLFLFGSLALFLLGSGRYSLSRGKGRWD